MISPPNNTIPTPVVAKVLNSPEKIKIAIHADQRSDRKPQTEY
jgi:hypothetical protein